MYVCTYEDYIDPDWTDLVYFHKGRHRKEKKLSRPLISAVWTPPPLRRAPYQYYIIYYAIISFMAKGAFTFSSYSSRCLRPPPLMVVLMVVPFKHKFLS